MLYLSKLKFGVSVPVHATDKIESLVKFINPSGIGIECISLIPKSKSACKLSKKSIQGNIDDGTFIPINMDEPKAGQMYKYIFDKHYIDKVVNSECDLQLFDIVNDIIILRDNKGSYYYSIENFLNLLSTGMLTQIKNVCTPLEGIKDNKTQEVCFKCGHKTEDYVGWSTITKICPVCKV